MKSTKKIAILLIVGAALCASASFAEGRPGRRPTDGQGGQRPAGSYGNWGQRPANAPQRPTGSWGNAGQRPSSVPGKATDAAAQTRGQRPAGIPARPTNSWGRRGERPANAPQRPAGTYGQRPSGGRPGGQN